MLMLPLSLKGGLASKAEGLSVPYEGAGASGNSSPAGFVGDDASVSEDVYFRLSI